MPANLQALLLLLVFIAPGFVFVEVDTRRRPAQKLAAFDKTVLSILFSTLLHAVLLWPTLLCFSLCGFDLARVLDANWLLNYVQQHVLLTYTFLLVYFFVAIAIAVFCGFKVGALTSKWTPVLSRSVRRDRPNPVLVHMKNGDFYTGILGMIPADYDVLQGPAKDFTVIPPGRYKPKGKRWPKLQEGEIVLLNTANVDAVRLM
ncbi:MAG: DUF6338 family protein [Planctomycetota bacterium]|jgi:hypothetical protein